MVVELHVIGPGLGLPSIDAECLAAVFYLREAFNKQENTHDKGWRLVASNNYDVSPFRQLPALRIDVAQEGGSTDSKFGGDDLWIAGYDNIVAFLEQDTSMRTKDLDENLNATQEAESYALSSFIRSQGGPLLDLSLYVSSENYNTRIRPVLGELLRWPESWILPHRLREAARTRSEHLGLSALDVDMLQEQEEKEMNRGIAAHIPKSLRKPKQTLVGMLSKSAQHTKFRLEVVTDDLFDPLQEKLVPNSKTSQTQSLLGDAGFHSVDCLALGYLALMQRSDLPQTWLRDSLATRYPVLGDWISVHADSMLGSVASTSSSEVAGQAIKTDTLPWAEPPKRQLWQTTSAAIENLIATIPGFNYGYQPGQITTKNAGGKPSHKDRQLAYTQIRKKQIMYSQILTSTITATSLVAWLLHAGILSFHFSSSKTTNASPHRSFGEAGSLLGLR